MDRLQEMYPDNIFIGTLPAVKTACERDYRNIMVMATTATITSAKLKEIIDENIREGQNIYPVACPGLVEFVEAGLLEGPEVESALHALLDPCLEKGPDAIVLGCTHYPFLRRAIRAVAGDGPVILDGSEGTARQLRRELTKKDLLTKRSRPGIVQFEMSLPGKEALCRRLLTQEHI